MHQSIKDVVTAPGVQAATWHCQAFQSWVNLSNCIPFLWRLLSDCGVTCLTVVLFFLILSGFQVKACLIILSTGLQRVWPIHPQSLYISWKVSIHFVVHHVYPPCLCTVKVTLNCLQWVIFDSMQVLMTFSCWGAIKKTAGVALVWEERSRDHGPQIHISLVSFRVQGLGRVESWDWDSGGP